jgi:hypothetical protein
MSPPTAYAVIAAQQVAGQTQLTEKRTEGIARQLGNLQQAAAAYKWPLLWVP